MNILSMILCHTGSDSNIKGKGGGGVSGVYLLSSVPPITQ